MKIEFLSKFNNISRRALAIVLCLGMILGGTTLSRADGEVGLAYHGYEWTRVKSATELANLRIHGLNDKNENQVTKKTDGNYSSNDENSWFRTMLVYKDQYFVSGTATANDGEAMKAAKILATYGVNSGKDKFETRTGLQTPYIKFVGTDKDNNNCNQFYFRFPNSNDSGLGDKMLVLNCNWAGIVGAASIYGQFWFTSVLQPKPYTRGWACNDTVIAETNMDFNSDGTVRLYYNVPGTTDRRWYVDSDTPSVVETAKYSEQSFKLYIGQPIPVKIISSTDQIAPGTTENFINATIGDYEEVLVPKNAALAISGVCYNNGKITVDGGTLIIQGVLDSDNGSQLDGTVNNIHAGDIELKNGGVLIIEEEGCVITRHSSELKASGGSAIVISGCYIGQGEISLDKSTMRVRSGGALLHAFKPGDTTASNSFGRKFIRDHKSDYLDKYGSESGTAKVSLTNGSSFICEGLWYEHGSGVSSGGSTMVGTVSTNYHAKISDMMKYY